MAGNLGAAEGPPGPGDAHDGERSPHRETAGRPTVGLDIGGTKTLAALLAPDGEVLAQTRLVSEPGPEAVVSVAARAVEDVVRQAGTDVAGLDAVGLGVPGIIDHDSGTVRHAVNLGVDGTPLPLAARLREILRVPVVVDNDLNVAALGAAHLRSAPPADDPDDPGLAARKERPVDLAFLSLGTGLAAGLVLDGQVRRGGGAAGEIGHVPYDPAGPRCPCGQRGCLELYASGTALDRLWTGAGGPAGVALFDAAAWGMPEAIGARDAFADAVAAAVRILVLSVDVRTIVLGGGVAQLGDPLLDAVRDALHRQAHGSPFLESLRIAGRVALAPAHQPVAAVGAAVLARSPHRIS